MIRFVLVSLVTFSAAILIDAAPAKAIRISPQNPSAGYNIHGLNYGSVQWEKARGNNPSLFPRQRSQQRSHSKRFFFRRWR